MRVVLQRVSSATVVIDGIQHAAIGSGLLLLLGITHDDNSDDSAWLISKIINMRIFNDAQGVMNLSVKDFNGSVLVVSQFTLHASVKKGNRPSYIAAARPEVAIPLYEDFLQRLRTEVHNVKEGIFGTDMKVSLVNDGPVTILIDSKNRQ